MVLNTVGMRTRMSRAAQVERNRELLLDAARRVFLDRGYVGATLDAIAEEAGFSKGVVYSQFAGKADLFLALLGERIEQRGQQNERAAESLAGSAAIDALLQAARRDAEAEAGWALLLVEFRAQAARDPEINLRYAHLHAQAIDRFAGLLARAHEDAGLEPVFPLRHLAEFIMAMGPAYALESAVHPAALPPYVFRGMVLAALGLSPDLPEVSDRATQETP